MLRNSEAKVSISAVSTRSWREKRLYITTAGMAAASPTAVAISASAIPGATAWMLDEVVVERPRNAVMMPQTVPKSPMNGAVLAVVARKVSPRSSRVTSCVRPHHRSGPGDHVEDALLVTGQRLGELGQHGAPPGDAGRELGNHRVRCALLAAPPPTDRATVLQGPGAVKREAPKRSVA